MLGFLDYEAIYVVGSIFSMVSIENQSGSDNTELVFVLGKDGAVHRGDLIRDGRDSAIIATPAGYVEGIILATGTEMHHLLREAHPSPEEMRQSWDEQENGIWKLRQFHGKVPPEDVFGKGRFQKAFAPLKSGDTLYVGCSDDRCGWKNIPGEEGIDMHRFCLLGSGVFLQDARHDFELQKLREYQDMGVTVIPTYHDGCAACGIQAKIEGRDAMELGRETAQKLAQEIGIDPSAIKHMGYGKNVNIPMLAYPAFHPARTMIVDLSNRMYHGSYLGIKPFMKLNRYTKIPGHLINDIRILLSVMMDEHHAFGRSRFEQDPFMIGVIGVDTTLQERLPGFSSTLFTEILQAQLEEHDPEILKAVQIVGFDAPPRSAV